MNEVYTELDSDLNDNVLYSVYKYYKDTHFKQEPLPSNLRGRSNLYVEWLDVNGIPSIRLHHHNHNLDLSLYFLDCLDEKEVKNLFRNFILTS